MFKLFISLLTFGFCINAVASTTKISLEDYAKHAQFIDVKISPSGKYLAVSNRADDGNIRVIVLDRLNLATVSQTHFRGEDTINALCSKLIIAITRKL